MRIQFIKYIHEKTLIEGTGSPKELGLLLNTSERTIYNYIKYMRLELKAPIVYNRTKCTYLYDMPCNINFIHNDAT